MHLNALLNFFSALRFPLPTKLFLSISYFFMLIINQFSCDLLVHVDMPAAPKVLK